MRSLSYISTCMHAHPFTHVCVRSRGLQSCPLRAQKSSASLQPCPLRAQKSSAKEVPNSGCPRGEATWADRSDYHYYYYYYYHYYYYYYYYCYLLPTTATTTTTTTTTATTHYCCYYYYRVPWHSCGGQASSGMAARMAAVGTASQIWTGCRGTPSR